MSRCNTLMLELDNTIIGELKIYISKYKIVKSIYKNFRHFSIDNEITSPYYRLLDYRTFTCITCVVRRDFHYGYTNRNTCLIKCTLEYSYVYMYVKMHIYRFLYPYTHLTILRLK